MALPNPNDRKGFPVDHSIAASPSWATPDTHAVLALLQPLVLELAAAIAAFRAQHPTPERTFAFENAIAAIQREGGRVVVEHEYNHVEPAALTDCPLRLRFAGEEYRRRPRSLNRIGTRFGEIELRRFLYEAVEPGEPAIFPLEAALGIEAGLATPALAERVGAWAVDHEQEQVRRLLRSEHGVAWSVDSLRRLTAALRDGMASFREEAPLARLQELLEKAFASRGRHRPVLAAGRDGVHVPIRQDGYHEGAAATRSVQDRRGKRLGTVYLGRMPEPGQGTLSAPLTNLLERTLARWHALGRPAPRLAYLTDGGHHPKEYYLRTLRRLDDPWRPGRKLQWQWVLDFWHACGHLGRLAEALFGEGAKATQRFAQWRRWLRDRRRGVTQVLRSAMGLHNRAAPLRGADRVAFWKAYRYLRKHAAWMRYAEYRSQGMPIGSGVTEAACKTVFAERLKRSGMTWSSAGGQVILDLRVLVLSGVRREAHAAYLRSKPQPTLAKPTSQAPRHRQTLGNAA